MGLGGGQLLPKFRKLKVCCMECSRVVCVDCVGQTTSSNEPLEGHEKFICTHVGTEFQVHSPSGGTCEESDVSLVHITPHVNVQWSSKVYADHGE